MALPEIGVITPSSGRRELLLAKFASLQRQTVAPERFEWLVCLNGPDDGSAAALQQTDAPFALRLVRRDEPLSPAAARNLAVSLASSPLLLFSDDDCLLEPGCLAAHLRCHQRYGRSVGVGPVRLPAELRASGVREPFEQVAALAGRVLWINATGTNTSVPTEAFRRAGGYDESFAAYGGEDPDLAYRLRRAGLTFRYLPDALVHHHGRQLGGDSDKAYRAGQAHWRVYRKHRSIEVGLLLGVHPWLLGAKRLLFGSGLLPDSERTSYERAYLRGALEARSAPDGD